MKIYTKTGDKGTTSLIYGQRVAKNNARVDAYGSCDEANSVIGLALSYLKNTSFEGMSEFEQIFYKIQTTIFHVGAELATPAGKEVKWKIKDEDIVELEKQIDVWDSELEPLSNFILPGGHPCGATLHVARTVVRRAERSAVTLGDEINPLVLSYLNRLSDFLFVAARYINLKLNEMEKPLLPNS
ncbi:MAG TPA: cob(I)yrinic acid a,c-diamide adenosyltransferase [Pseudoneobacillus sp.]|nr:cob(I)yrinic acid a,c-diamide adenosyltransferase [Pseudoneobacillus sp.]